MKLATVGKQKGVRMSKDHKTLGNVKTGTSYTKEVSQFEPAIPSDETHNSYPEETDGCRDTAATLRRSVELPEISDDDSMELRQFTKAVIVIASRFELKHQKDVDEALVAAKETFDDDLQNGVQSVDSEASIRRPHYLTILKTTVMILTITATLAALIG